MPGVPQMHTGRSLQPRPGREDPRATSTAGRSRKAKTAVEYSKAVGRNLLTQIHLPDTLVRKNNPVRNTMCCLQMLFLENTDRKASRTASKPRTRVQTVCREPRETVTEGSPLGSTGEAQGAALTSFVTLALLTRTRQS